MNVSESIKLTSDDNNSDNLNEDQFINWLNNIESFERVIFVHGKFICKICIDSDLSVIKSVDPQSKSKNKLKTLARKKQVSGIELEDSEVELCQEVKQNWKPTLYDEQKILDILDSREQFLGRKKGRGKSISKTVAQRVWCDARGLCMFEGCAEDLTKISLSNVNEKVGYLAHIIASNPNGPRGDHNLSHQLANDPENLMLMCDTHHRLIDVYAPSVYGIKRLRDMRVCHKETMDRYCAAMKYPRVKAIAMLADLSGVLSYFTEQSFANAILGTRGNMLPRVQYYLRREQQRDDRSSENFWSQYLHEHERDIQQLSGRDKTDLRDGERIAIFPLHHVPTLVLSGRLIGEAANIEIFQFHRERREWSWDTEIQPLDDGAILHSDLPKRRSDSVLLSLELTANVDIESLPKELKSSSLPWVRITVIDQRTSCISHPNDLKQFMNIARRVVLHIHDVMCVRHVHLVAISPASTIFGFGQLLQPGHHPEYTVYDRPNGDTTFRPALSITGRTVFATNFKDKSIILIQ